jgi:hypothetical protein
MTLYIYIYIYNLWQSPKSRPHIFIVLSADPDINIFPSYDISKHITGNLCPYNDKKNFNESSKNILIVQSSRPIATNNLS